MLSTEVTRPTTPDGLREALERRLRRHVDDDKWTYLVEKFYVSEGLESESDPVGFIEKEYRRLPGTARGRSPTGPVTLVQTSPPDRRFSAIADQVAEDASSDGEVLAFRHMRLGKELLTPADADQWIEDRAAAEGESYFFEAGVSRADFTEALRRGRTTMNVDFAGRKSLVKGLAWRDQHGNARQCLVAAGGDLEHLYALSHKLADRYGWQLEQLPGFLISGTKPELHQVIARAHYDYQRPELSRIVLDIHPSATNADIQKQLRKMRAWLDGDSGDRPAVSSHKRMSEKHVSLARFSLEEEQRSTKRLSWRQRMQQWNGSHPEWAYEDVRRFSRDSKQAVERVYGPVVE